MSGRKTLLITGGGQLNGADGWVAGRLASKFGLDITVASDGTITAADAQGAALIYNSSTVNSGKVAGNGIQELAIPIVDVEAGNVDDFFLADAPLGWGNDSSIKTVEITQEDHPINAGLAPGEQTFNTKNVQYHWGTAPIESVVIGHAPGNEGQATIYAIEAGAEMLEDLGEEVVFTHPARRVFTHPARRVFFGVTGNDGADTCTEVGVQLFDAAITWALAEPTLGGGIPEVKEIADGDDVSVSFTTTSPDSDHVLQRATDLRNGQIDSEAMLTQDGDLFSFSTTPNNDIPNEQFRVGILGPPALFSEDFESGAEGWAVARIAGDNTWELGTPTVDAGSAARSGSNAYGTDLDGDYGDNVNATLTSPVIDLTDARRARLTFWYVVDTDEGTEGVQLQFITESGSVIGTFDTILSGQSNGWVEEDIRLSSDVVGQKIKLLFTFLTDPNEPRGAGFYLDDLEVND